MNPAVIPNVQVDLQPLSSSGRARNFRGELSDVSFAPVSWLRVPANAPPVITSNVAGQTRWGYIICPATSQAIGWASPVGWDPLRSGGAQRQQLQLDCLATIRRRLHAVRNLQDCIAGELREYRHG